MSRPRPRRPHAGLAILLALLAFPEVSWARVRAFLLGGQSNMVGYGRQEDLLSHADVPGVWIWSAAYGRSGSWQPLGPGFGRNDSSFGPELSLGTVLAEAFPADTLVLLKTAIGGTSLAEEWRSPSRGEPGVFYPYLRIWEGLANDQWPWVGGEFPALEGVFWLQGESDALDSAMADSYAVNLQAFIEDVRHDWQDSSLPWVVGMLDSTPAWIYVTQIRSAQRRVGAGVPGVAMVETVDLPDDGAHFDSRGVWDLGRRMAEAWLVMTNTPRHPGGGVVSRDVRGKERPLRSGGSTDWAGILSGVPAGSRVRWLDLKGRTISVWVQDRETAPPRAMSAGAGVVLVRDPGGRISVRKVPPAFLP